MTPTYYEQHRDEVKARSRAYYHANRDAINAARKAQRGAGLEKKSTEYVRNWRVKNPDKALALKLKKYGMTLEQYQAVLADQDGKCKICGDHMAKPNVDHNHKTGAFRGLLCRSCNIAIGLLKDDSFRALSAAAYLQVTSRKEN